MFDLSAKNVLTVLFISGILEWNVVQFAESLQARNMKLQAAPVQLHG